MFIQVGSGTDTGGDPPLFRISGNSPHLGLLVQSDIEYDGTQTHFSGSPKIHTWTHAPQGLITKRARHRKHSFSENKRKCTSKDGRIELQPKKNYEWVYTCTWIPPLSYKRGGMYPQNWNINKSFLFCSSNKVLIVYYLLH